MAGDRSAESGLVIVVSDPLDDRYPQGTASCPGGAVEDVLRQGRAELIDRGVVTIFALRDGARWQHAKAKNLH